VAESVAVRLGSKPHVLYRMYDPERRLLYVGLTTNLEDRLADHRSMKRWWRDVATIELEHFPTREGAVEAERRAIIDDVPEYNVTNGYAEPNGYHWRPAAHQRPDPDTEVTP
jgi:excinuclease UvrABC nuclease subunit